jgi:ABC-type spermidine/putrescine transport system permease subunit I
MHALKNLLLLPGIEIWFVQFTANSLYWLPYSSHEDRYKSSASYFFLFEMWCQLHMFYFTHQMAALSTFTRIINAPVSPCIQHSSSAKWQMLWKCIGSR